MPAGGTSFLVNPELMLHLFEGNSLCLRIEKENDEELHYHHDREEEKWGAAGLAREDRKRPRDDGVGNPMRRAAETLSFGANTGGKDLTDVDPDDGALRD